MARDLKIPLRGINTQGVERLKSYDFPGNIRELRNLIERALILSSRPEIGPDDFPLPGTAEAAFPAATGGNPLSWIRAMPETVSLRELLEEVEKGLILRALKSSGGVQAEAARRLQLSRSDLAYKLNKHQIQVDRE